MKIAPQSMPNAKTDEREALDQVELLLRDMLGADEIGLTPMWHERVRMALGCVVGSKTVPGRPRDLWQSVCTAESALRFLLDDRTDIQIIGRHAYETKSRARHALEALIKAKSGGAV